MSTCHVSAASNEKEGDDSKLVSGKADDRISTGYIIAARDYVFDHFELCDVARSAAAAGAHSIPSPNSEFAKRDRISSWILSPVGMCYLEQFCEPTRATYSIYGLPIQQIPVPLTPSSPLMASPELLCFHILRKTSARTHDPFVRYL